MTNIHFTPSEIAAMRRLIRCFTKTFDDTVSVQQINDVLALTYRMEAKSDQTTIIDRAIKELEIFDLCTRCGKYLVEKEGEVEIDPICHKCRNELRTKEREEKLLD